MMKYVQSKKNVLLTNCDNFGTINPHSEKEKNMVSFEPKKLALIRILQILEQYTDSDHPLKHDEIVKKLENEYGITVERKAIGRNIALLQDVGYDIATTKKGSYLNSRASGDCV